MITRVTNVLVANTACPSSYTADSALNSGEAALFDENGKLITSEAGAVAAKSIKIGVCTGKMDVIDPASDASTSKNKFEFSNEIKKGSIISNVLTAYKAPVQEKITINLASATIVAGHRYVLRIVYKDLYEDPGQFTHTYETIATSSTPQDLCDAFGKLISKHPNRRVSVAYTGNNIVLTALAKDDNEGVNSINEYSIVNMEATIYSTIPGALLSNAPETVAGMTITKTAGDPGKGYWKQVRDAEMRNMGYKGMVFIDAYPVIEQEKKVDPSLTYDSLVIEHDNKYVSCDNQYVKSNPLTEVLYVKAGSLSTSTLNKLITAFITGVDTSSLD